MDDFGFNDKRNELGARTPGTVNVTLIGIVLIASVVSLGELSLTFAGVVNVSLTVAVLYVVSSIIYKNSYAENMIMAKNTPEYIEAKEEFDKAVLHIESGDILTRMPEYITRYCEEDLRSCRAAVLLDGCIKYDIYEEKYLGKSADELKEQGLSHTAINCVLAANKVRSINLTAQKVMSTGEDVTLAEKVLRSIGLYRSFGMESKTREQIDFGTNMISRAITTLLAGTVGVGLIMDDFNLQSIAAWAMKMLPIAVAGMSGANSGQHNVLDTLVPQLKKKTKIMKTIIKWHEEEKNK